MLPSYSIPKNCCATTYIEGVSIRRVKDGMQLRWSLGVNQQGIKLLANLRQQKDTKLQLLQYNELIQGLLNQLWTCPPYMLIYLTSHLICLT